MIEGGLEGKDLRDVTRSTGIVGRCYSIYIRGYGLA